MSRSDVLLLIIHPGDEMYEGASCLADAIFRGVSVHYMSVGGHAARSGVLPGTALARLTVKVLRAENEIMSDSGEVESLRELFSSSVLEHRPITTLIILIAHVDTERGMVQCGVNKFAPLSQVRAPTLSS